jgi:hypothetical protein
MGANGFREDELVSRKVKVGQEWQTRVFPVVGGRLRILHESNDHLSIQTEIVRLEPDFVVVRAAVESQRGRFNGTGTASAQRDARLADSLVELAETRAIARALRFGGIGVEYTGAEEVSHVAAAEPEKEETSQDQTGGNGSKGQGCPIDSRGANQDGEQNTTDSVRKSKRQPCPIEKPHSNGAATSAQVRALYALTKRANYHEADVASLLAPFQVSRFEDLPREAASQLIGYIQQEVAA